MSRERGFSLIEVLFACIVLFLVGFALMSVSYSSLRAKTKSKQNETASRLADTELNRFAKELEHLVDRSSVENFWGRDYPSGSTPYSEVERTVGRETYRVRVFTETVPNLSGVETKKRAKKIDVRVSWWNEERQGYGRMNSGAFRVIFEDER